MIWAQWTMLALLIFGFGIELERAGKPRKDLNYNRGGYVLIIAAINFALIASAGGFSKLLGWPE